MAEEMKVFDLIQAGDREGLKALLVENPDLGKLRDARGVSALIQALYHFKEDLAELLAEGHDDLDLLEAAAMGDEERVSALLSEDSSTINRFSADGFSALQYAAFFCRPEVLRLLLDQGADPRLASRNEMSLTALHSAAARGSVGMAALLLERGAGVNARQQGGYTPLMAAANLGNRELAELLLNHGADAAMACEDGKSAAGLARQKGFEALAELLEG